MIIQNCEILGFDDHAITHDKDQSNFECASNLFNHLFINLPKVLPEPFIVKELITPSQQTFLNPFH
jgi:hypothetical protein